MEEPIEQQLAVSTEAVESGVQDAITHLDAASTMELACAFALPLLALLLGILFNRWHDKRPNHLLHEKILDWAGPLIAPLLAVAFVMAAGYTLRSQKVELFVLPFVWKLAVAWFAIQLVSLVSSRQGTGWIVILIIAPITLMQLFGVWEPFVDTLTNLEFTFGGATFNAYGALKSVGALIALFWVAGFLVRATDARLRRIRTMHVSNRVLVMKIFQIVLYFVVFLIGLQVLGVSLTALSVLGGAVGVGIGFGLQKIASNFISGIILLFEKSVSVDDLIELADGTTGFIRQNAARYTRIELYDGREVFIPNEEFITQRVTTLTHTTRRGRVEVAVGVSYDSDIEQVREILIEAAKSCPKCSADPAPNAFFTEFGESSLNFILYFWVEDVVDGRMGPKHDVMRTILEQFREHNISIPFPHQVQIADPAMEERFEQLEKRIESPGKSPAAKTPKTAEKKLPARKDKKA